MRSVKAILFTLIVFLSFTIYGLAQTTVTFNYTGGAQNWVVPPCVTSINVTVEGAQGGGANGGLGAVVTATLAVTPGQTLQINVGGQGGCPGAGFNGGGPGANASGGGNGSCAGGGASDIRVAPNGLANRLVVAGGGGGMGGGNTDALAGGGGCGNGVDGDSPFGVGGYGGTQTSGGAGGPPWIPSGNAGGNGALGTGGAGATDPCYNLGPGGGGGGGYYGGGGGGSDCYDLGSLGGGGGGGGSSLTPAGGGCAAATNAGNGVVTITYTVGAGVATATNTGPYCVGQTIQLNSGAGGIDYDWTGPGGYVQNNTQNPTRPGATLAMGGTYTVLVTFAGGCTATATTTVVVNANPTPTATNGGPYCVGQTIQLNSPTGSATDDWTGPGGYVQANMQNPTRPGATLAMAGVYTVTVTNAAGCSATATTTVVVNANPTPTATNGGPYCVGQTIQLNSPTGSATDDWTGPGGYVQANMQNPTRPGATLAMAGVYTVTVTNAAGCSATATTTVVVNALPTPTATNGGPYCVGQTIQLNSPAGSATDDWTGPGGYVQANMQNPTRPGATLAMAGVYTVTVTNAAGCSATATTTVVVNALPTPTATNGGPYCVGATIQLNSPTGSATDDWTGPGGYVQANMQNPTLPGATLAMAGVYTVTVTNAAGCSATATTTVVVNALPTPTANNTGPYCAGATIQLNSPTGSATDDWTGPGGYIQNNLQNPTIAASTVAMSGVYTVTVTNAAGCSATATTTVVVNANPTPTATNTGPYCAGATIQLNSPTGSATDDWTGPSGYVQNNMQNPTIAGSTLAMNGVYTVTVTNAAGCSATATTTVVVNANPTPTATNTGPYCSGQTIQLNSPTGSATDDWAGPGGYVQNNMQNPTIVASTPSMSGVYTVTVTNAAGCSATATTTVTVNLAAVATANNTGPYCAGATINLTSGAGAIDYDWTGPGGYVQNNTQNPNIAGSTVAMSGVYTVSITQAGGCTGTATTTVVVNANPTPTANNTGPYCAGATIQLNSPTGSATDDWTGPGGYVQNNLQNPTIAASTVAMSGVYTVTVTNAAGCSATATTTVVVNANPTPTANNTGPYCAGATIQLNSPTGSATDDWTGPGGYIQNNLQNPTIAASTVAMSGVYTVTVTNAAGCSATATTTVVVNANPTPTATNTGPYCAGATIQLNSPTGSATDDWTGPGGYVQNNLQNPTIAASTVAMSGVYTVTVTNAAGCSTTATTTVVVNANPTPTATNTGPYCSGATIQLNSPTGSATDDWTGPGGYIQNNMQNPTIAASTVAMSGVYTVTVTNAAGCSATATTTVTVNTAASATANNTGPYCVGATINLSSGAGAIDYDWTGPGGYVQNNTQNPTIAGSTIAMNGVYTVSITMAGGCTGTATTTVVVNANPTPTANNTGPYCAGATIQLNSPTGSATDDWTGPSGYVQNNTQNPTIALSTLAMNGVYTVTVTNAAGCSATATTTVVVNANPTPTANNTGPYCLGATIQLNSPTGSGTDDWTGPGGYVQNNMQNPTIASSTLAMNGVYTVTVTNAAGCSATATTTVVVNALPTPTANNTGPYCVGATIQLNSPSGFVTDDWTGPGGYVQNNMQNPTIAGSTLAMNGVYTVTVTAGTGCSATATTTVVVNANPTPTATNTGPYCSGSTIQLNSPTGSGTDDWAGPLGYVQNNVQNPTIAGSTTAMSGVYTVTVTNAAGCSATATTTVTVNSAASPSASNTGPYCAGATINLSSPAGAIDYDWVGPGGYVQNNTQNPTIAGSTVAMSGAYTVTMTMAGGCSGTASTTVVVNPLPTPTANNTGPYCFGATIQLNSPTGSGTDDWTGPSGYVQNNAQNPTIINATVGMTGNYTVTVTDANGCSATATTNVTVNPLPTPTANNTGPYCAGVNIQLNSPTGSATDNWTGPGGYTQNNMQNPIIAGATIAMSGVYTVSVTDANGCNNTATTTVVVNSLPTPTANNTGAYCAGATIQLNSPSGFATDDWTGPAGYVQNNTQNPTIAGATITMNGVYTVSVTDANGCNATATTSVVVNALPTPFANNTGPYCDGANMDLSSGGGVDYDWSGPAGFVLNDTQNGTIPNVNPGMSGTYTVSVTDVNGCNSTTTTLVTINGLPATGANNTSPICEFQNFDLNANGGVTYDWTGPGGYNQPNTQNPTITNASLATAGTYTVTVTDANGCVSTTTTVVVVNPNITLVAGSNSPICSGVQLDLNAQPIAGVNYDWTGPNGFNVVNQQNPSLPGATTLATGTYTVLATNGNGCTGTATVNVTVNPLPIPQLSGDVLVGCAPVCVNFSDQSSGNGGTIASWIWNVESQNANTSQNPSFCFNNPGTYDANLSVTTTDGCSASITLANYITVHAIPVAQFDFTPKEIDIDDPEVTFASTSTGATSWTWLFGDGGTSNIENPIHMYQDTGEYCILLTVSNNAGCTDTASGCLYIQPVFNFFIPNAFTPNEDGLNETFNIYGTGVKTIIVRIFDRWGEEIFSFDSMDKGWPGVTTNGEPCKQDVYVYRIEVVDGKNDFHEFMGSVTLIR